MSERAVEKDYNRDDMARAYDAGIAALAEAVSQANRGNYVSRADVEQSNPYRVTLPAEVSEGCDE